MQVFLSILSIAGTLFGVWLGWGLMRHSQRREQAMRPFVVAEESISSVLCSIGPADFSNEGDIGPPYRAIADRLVGPISLLKAYKTEYYKTLDEAWEEFYAPPNIDSNRGRDRRDATISKITALLGVVRSIHEQESQNQTWEGSA
jgi:hypothetical protein